MDTPKALSRGLTLAILLAGIGIAFGGCAANSQFATFGGAGPSLPRAEYAVKGKTAYDQDWIDRTIEAEVAGFGIARPAARPAGLDAKPAIKAKPAVIALPPSPAPVDTAIDAPPKEKWTDKLHHDIHAAKLRLDKWNEEIKSYPKPGQGDQQATGSGTASAVVAAAGGIGGDHGHVHEDGAHSERGCADDLGRSAAGSSSGANGGRRLRLDHSPVSSRD